MGGGGGGQGACAPHFFYWGGAMVYLCFPPPPNTHTHTHTFNHTFYFPLELYVYITLTNNYLAFFIYQLIILWTISLNWHRWLLVHNHISKYNLFILVLYRRYINYVSVCLAPPLFGTFLRHLYILMKYEYSHLWWCTCFCVHMPLYWVCVYLFILFIFVNFKCSKTSAYKYKCI